MQDQRLNISRAAFNAVIDDKTISYKAKGIWVYMACHPGAVWSASYIQRASRDGRHAIRAGLLELLAAGHVKSLGRGRYMVVMEGVNNGSE